MANPVSEQLTCFEECFSSIPGYVTTSIAQALQTLECRVSNWAHLFLFASAQTVQRALLALELTPSTHSHTHAQSPLFAGVEVIYASEVMLRRHSSGPDTACGLES